MDKVIWKLLGEWSYFVGNILMGVKDVSTYQKKQKKKKVYISKGVKSFFVFQCLIH